MAKFCRKCGSPLENGYCPVCDAAPDAEPYEEDWAPARPVGPGGLLDPVLAVFSSRDISAVLAMAGFVLMVLSSLLLFIGAVADSGVFIVGKWIGVIAMLLTGAYLVRYFRTPDKSSEETIMASVIMLFAVNGVTSLPLLVRGVLRSPFLSFFTGLVLILFFHWQQSEDPSWSRICLITFGTLTAGLLLYYFGGAVGEFILYLIFIPASFVCAVTFARSMVYGD